MKKIFLTLLFFNFLFPNISSFSQSNDENLKEKFTVYAGVFSQFRLYYVPYPETDRLRAQYPPAVYTKQFPYVGLQTGIGKNFFLFFEQGFTYGALVLSNSLGYAHDLNAIWNRTAMGFGYLKSVERRKKYDIRLFIQNINTLKYYAILDKYPVGDNLVYFHDMAGEKTYYITYLQSGFYYKKAYLGIAFGKIHANDGIVYVEKPGQVYFFSVNLSYNIFSHQNK